MIVFSNPLALDEHKQDASNLYELMAMDDTAPFDETRGITPVPNVSWLPPLLDELPRISLRFANAVAAPGADLVAERVLGEGGWAW